MAYSDFTLEKAAAVLGITTQEADLFPELVPLFIPSWLNETLGKRTQLALISGLLFIPIESAIAEIVEVYIQQHLMPKDPLGDALHLALASYHKFDFLLTWNCRHLANANKFGHIRRLNVMLGLFVPTLVTPLELIGAQNDEE